MKKNSGFTLIEVVITLALAALLVTLSLPSFRGMIQNNRATTQANDMLSALNLARSEAVKRGTPVSICARTDPPTSPESCSGAADWATGWLVFVDGNANGTLEPDANGNGVCDRGEDCLLQTRPRPDGNPTLVQTAGGTNIRFLGSGQAAANAQFDLKLPDCTGEQARSIDVDRSGRSAVAVSSC